MPVSNHASYCHHCLWHTLSHQRLLTVYPAFVNHARSGAGLTGLVSQLSWCLQKAGPRFEATVRAKEKANPKFAFLLPWNHFHAYYRYVKRIISFLLRTQCLHLVCWLHVFKPFLSLNPVDVLSTSLSVLHLHWYQSEQLASTMLPKAALLRKISLDRSCSLRQFSASK